VSNELEIKAIKVEFNDYLFFVGAAKATDLFKVSVVLRADEDPENGFQRVLGKTRANQIAEYFNNGNVIPGSIVLSSKNNVPDYDNKQNMLKLHMDSEELLVIDGQHRLYGASLAEDNVYLPFCIFYGLNKVMEVQYFLDINGYQMGVPKTLRLELQKFIAEEDSEEFILKSLFDELESNPRSPLSGKMSRTKSVAGKISHVSFQSGLKPILNRIPLNSFNIKQKKLVLLNFFSALEFILIDIFGDSKKLSNAAFFQAIMWAFPDICHTVRTKSGNYKQEYFQDVLEVLGGINWEENKGTNNHAIKQLTAAITDAVSGKNNIRDDMF